MLVQALSSARDLGRLREIASVLVRHGLGETVRRLGLARVLARAGERVHWGAAQDLSKEPSVRLREALEELGPTFVKVGQLLAGRSDLLAPIWTEELSRLHQRAAEVPIADIRSQLVQDLGAEPEAVFSSFDPVPIAAASIAQVHRARLLDGREVILKVRRPGIRETVEADLRLLARLAERLEARVPELRHYRPRSLIRQFSRSLRNELDLRIEAQNAERMRRNLPAGSELVIPEVHEEWTCERLCVMEYLSGPSLGDWTRGRDSDPERAARIAEQGTRALLHMIFLDGCFHADPHPGNLLLLAGDRLGLIDFGMVGALSEVRRRELIDLLAAVAAEDPERAVDTLISWSPGEVDTASLTHDCSDLISRYAGRSIEEFDTTELLGELGRMLRDNNLFLPAEVAQLLKVFVTLDDLGRRLAPQFAMATHVAPFARRAWKAQHAPRAVLRRGSQAARALLYSLPADLRQLNAWIRRGRLHVNVDLERLEHFGQRIEHSTNRLTVGLVTAALIIGTAISLTVSGGPRVAGMPLFGFLGFASSLVGGIVLLWSILHSARD